MSVLDAELSESTFKKQLTDRLNQFYDALIKKGILAGNSVKSDFASLFDQKVQSTSKVLDGSRHLTQHQLTLLVTRTNLNPSWYLTGLGEMFIEQADTKKKVQLYTRITNEIANGDLEKELGLEIVDSLSYKDQLISKLKSDNLDLSQRLIKVMALVKDHNKLP